MGTFNNYVVQGAYTIAFTGDKILLIGDPIEDEETAIMESDNIMDLFDFLAYENCTGVYKQDGVFKVKFEKNINL